MSNVVTTFKGKTPEAMGKQEKEECLTYMEGRFIDEFLPRSDLDIREIMCFCAKLRSAAQ